MTQSTRKLIGTILTLLVLFAYAALASSIYMWLLIGLPTWVLLIYFAVAGIGWALPAGLIIRWMSRPDRDSEHG